MIEAGRRLSGEIFSLIDGNQYFVIHAARQSGKTTLLLNLTERLNREGKYYALYCSLERVQDIVDPEKGIPAVIGSLQTAFRVSGIPNGKDFAKEAGDSNYTGILIDSLGDFCRSLDKPLVIFFDEADCLSEGTLISFLRQLRNGYNTRVIAPFVHSLALVGMRNIRDFKARIRPDSETLGSASPFNIVAAAMTLRNFSAEEVAELYAQHTADTGQVFEPAAIGLAWQQTQGQPWLVNAIAREAVEKLLSNDYSQKVTEAHVEQAIQNIILRRDTHIDSLLERLKEPRVQRIIEPVILGEEGIINRLSDDFNYTRDLGLIRITDDHSIVPANPIYAEVIVRTLNSRLQTSLQGGENPYQLSRYFQNGRIDMNFLLRDFQQFWRENSAIWAERDNATPLN
jgi:AAA+ ATPase superfamily predicted ATPase